MRQERQKSTYVTIRMIRSHPVPEKRRSLRVPEGNTVYEGEPVESSETILTKSVTSVTVQWTPQRSRGPQVHRTPRENLSRPMTTPPPRTTRPQPPTPPHVPLSDTPPHRKTRSISITFSMHQHDNVFFQIIKTGGTYFL